jgi:hypothetical protein
MLMIFQKLKYFSNVEITGNFLRNVSNMEIAENILSNDGLIDQS